MLNPQTTSYDECRSDVIYYGNVYFLTILCALGIVLNTLNVYAFSRKPCKTHIGYHIRTSLTGLAIADALTCLVLIPVGLLKCFRHKSDSLSSVWNVYKTFFFWPLAYSFGTASVWITLLISVDRCLFITSASFKERKYLKIYQIHRGLLFHHIPHFPYTLLLSL